MSDVQNLSARINDRNAGAVDVATYVERLRVHDVYGKRVRDGYTFTYPQSDTFSG